MSRTAEDIIAEIRRYRDKRLWDSINQYDPKLGVSSNERPTCPHCGNGVTPDESHYYDENRCFDGECVACGEPFRLELNVQYTWTTYRKTNDDDVLEG